VDDHQFAYLKKIGKTKTLIQTVLKQQNGIEKKKKNIDTKLMGASPVSVLLCKNVFHIQG
jgi:hypothetical protein